MPRSSLTHYRFLWAGDGWPMPHRPGKPSNETMNVEREVRTVVLALSNLDRQRQELTVAMSMGR